MRKHGIGIIGKFKEKEETQERLLWRNRKYRWRQKHLCKRCLRHFPKGATQTFPRSWCHKHLSKVVADTFPWGVIDIFPNQAMDAFPKGVTEDLSSKSCHIMVEWYLSKGVTNTFPNGPTNTFPKRAIDTFPWRFHEIFRKILQTPF